jgi:hypothetical protein
MEILPESQEDLTEPLQPSRDESDFSVVIGGPLFQMLRRARMTGDALEMVRRRIVIGPLLLWLPLLVLSALEGRALGGVTVPFLYDIDVHARFLVALPLLMVAELVVHVRMKAIVERFVTMGLVRQRMRAEFDAAIASEQRRRNSVLAEVLLLVLVYGVGIMVLWRTSFALSTATWYATAAGAGREVYLAGWWYAFISLPLFQFVLLRWYFRIFIWARFLWQVSRIDLAYAPMHPDRLGGLGFLAGIGQAFAPLVLAQGALLSGLLANRILYQGATLPQFKLEIVAFVVIAAGVVILPLMAFVPALFAAKRAGLDRYRHLSMTYVRGFEKTWPRHGPGPGEPLVGSADVQSLADMGNAYGVVNEMRFLPVTRDMIVQLVVMALIPVAPLLLTMISLEQLLGQLLKVVF